MTGVPISFEQYSEKCLGWVGRLPGLAQASVLKG